MANLPLNIDLDNDGLDDNFEGSNTNDSNDVNDEIDNPSSSVLPDTDGDLTSSGDLDYRDLFNVNPPVVATIDFDGINDYLSGNSILNSLGQFTVMAWVKIDASNSGNAMATILGEGNSAKLYVQNGNKLMFTINTDTAGTHTLNGIEVSYNEWHHITGVFSNATGEFALFIDGQLESQVTDPSLIGATIEDSGSWNGNFEVGRLSRGVTNKEYFTGNIDEIRVFDIQLSDDQIQQMVYQEIEESSGYVKGKVVPKLIEDRRTEARVSWSNLLAYYPMTNIKNNTTLDHASGINTLNLINITTAQEQTAPMPYETSSSGSWNSESTWLHGNVWDIEQINTNKSWSIVNIKNDVFTNSSHTNFGLIIDSNESLTINGENKIENTSYLELNGTLDLQGDSQLVQTITSDLVTSSTGKILRRQEGTPSHYWYNYWASPVGSVGISALTDNNGNSNNSNNSAFKLNMLKKPDGSLFEFTSSYHQLGMISTFWTYTFINGLTYYDWASLNPNSSIQPGVGYTQKGTGISASEQQYVFEGKPNNGTIEISVTDVGGSGSVPSESKTDFLLGNPYPSAIDLHQFIDDNEGVIDGTIQLWQQWSGSSHYLDEYNGGYAQVNKLGATRAFQFVGLEGDNNGNQDGTKTPSRYLPVGQGFITEIAASGTVVFKNSQRLFIKESDADGTYNNGSVFFRNGSNMESSNSDNANSEVGVMSKIRLEFNSVDGPQTRRELLLGFSEFTSDDYDYGYEAKNAANNEDDLNLILGDQLMTMQAYSALREDKSVALALNASGSYQYSIKLTQRENIPEDFPIYIKDNLTGEFFDIASNNPYEFSSDQGQFNDRLEIVFSNGDDEVLSQLNETIEELKLYYASGRHKIVILNPNNLEFDSLEIINVLGQTVYSTSNLFSQTYSEYQLTNLTSGNYIVRLQTSTKQVLIKKIIVN
jgi:hypothetical protein